jgi:nucleotide-binding universal stress UspA family protein
MDYNKILVPLDGSDLAEIVLPHVEKIAKGCTVPQVILLTVTEPVHVKTPKGERIEQMPILSACSYFPSVALTLCP